MATGNRRKEGRDGSRAVRDALTVVALLAVVTTFSVSVETSRTPDATGNTGSVPASVGIPEAIAAESSPAVPDAAVPPAPDLAHPDAHAEALTESDSAPRVLRANCTDDGHCEMRIGDIHVVVDLPNLG